MSTAENQKSISTPTLAFHHVGVQTNDLVNSVSWYKEFFGAHENWSLDKFSELTTSRLSGIRRLVELAVGDGVRIHLFEREGRAAPEPTESVTQFQHLCMVVGTLEELVSLRERWAELYESGRFEFALAEKATPIVVDADGVRSFYAYDVNGLELEFTYVPPAA